MSDIRMCVRRQVTSGSQTPSILRRCRSMKYVVRQWLLINTSRTGIRGGGEEKKGEHAKQGQSHMIPRLIKQQSGVPRGAITSWECSWPGNLGSALERRRVSWSTRHGGRAWRQWCRQQAAQLPGGSGPTSSWLFLGWPPFLLILTLPLQAFEGMFIFPAPLLAIIKAGDWGQRERGEWEAKQEYNPQTLLLNGTHAQEYHPHLQIPINYHVVTRIPHYQRCIHRDSPKKELALSRIAAHMYWVLGVCQAWHGALVCVTS